MNTRLMLALMLLLAVGTCRAEEFGDSVKKVVMQQLFKLDDAIRVVDSEIAVLKQTKDSRYLRLTVDFQNVANVPQKELDKVAVYLAGQAHPLRDHVEAWPEAIAVASAATGANCAMECWDGGPLSNGGCAVAEVCKDFFLGAWEYGKPVADLKVKEAELARLKTQRRQTRKLLGDDEADWGKIKFKQIL